MKNLEILQKDWSRGWLDLQVGVRTPLQRPASPCSRGELLRRLTRTGSAKAWNTRCSCSWDEARLRQDGLRGGCAPSLAPPDFTLFFQHYPRNAQGLELDSHDNGKRDIAIIIIQNCPALRTPVATEGFRSLPGRGGRARGNCNAIMGGSNVSLWWPSPT